MEKIIRKDTINEILDMIDNELDTLNAIEHHYHDVLKRRLPFMESDEANLIFYQLYANRIQFDTIADLRRKIISNIKSDE